VARPDPRGDDRPVEGPPSLTSILVLVGPTGTGKSRIAASLAESIGGEIVGCDALQVYRGLDAATAKPTAADRSRVPHWVIDVADPRRDYSLADYVHDADAAIAAIARQGRVPVVVGGSGMYLRGLLKGLVDAPPRDEVLRRRLTGLARRFGSARLWRLLRRRDPGSAARVPPGDAQRIVRALELALSAGPTWSERLLRDGTWSKPGERYRALKFGLDLGREALAARLTDRVAAFFAAGLLGETSALLAAGVPPGANAFKAIGYREVVHALTAGEDPSPRLQETIVAATRRYARRQRTWFRTEPGVTWLDADESQDALVTRMADAWRVFRTPEAPRGAC
jgi:tRNA dimethylallyltransferase